MKQKTKSKKKIQILIEISFMITVTFQISRDRLFRNWCWDNRFLKRDLKNLYHNISLCNINAR